jgi:hypothetical protein
VRIGALALGAALVWGPAAVLHAQPAVTSLAVGAVAVRAVDAEAFTAATFSSAISWRSARLAAALRGSVSPLQAGWSQQGTAMVALFSPVSEGGWLAEVGGSAGGSAFPSGARRGQVLGEARVHWLGPRASAWLGGGLGAMRDGQAWRNVQRSELGVTLSGATMLTSAIANPTVVEDTLGFTDVLVAWSTAVGIADLALTVGHRLGASLPVVGGDERTWGSAALTLWAAPRGAIVLEGGTYPVDFTQGFPAGAYLTLGLRVGSPRAAWAAAARDGRAIRRTALRTGLRSVAVRRASANEVEVRVLAPDAQRVEVTGDLSRWDTVTLVRGADGVWWGRFTSEATVVELVVRVNGGEWLVPPGAQVVSDEFGGRSGRVVVGGAM